MYKLLSNTACVCYMNVFGSDSYASIKATATLKTKQTTRPVLQNLYSTHMAHKSNVKTIRKDCIVASGRCILI